MNETEMNDGMVTSTGDKNSSMRKYYIIGGVIVFIVCCIAFYFLYWIKTPKYSLNIIRDSIKNHDVVKFEQHVDMKTLYGRAIDDIVGEQIGNSNDKMNQFALGLFKAVKGVMVDELENQTKKYVETGNFEKKANDKTSNKQNNANDVGKEAANNLKNRVDTQGMIFKNIEKTEKDGKIAVITTKIQDEKLNKEFLIKLKMRELDNGEWQLTEINNLKEFIKEYDAAFRAKLNEINTPIKEKMASVFKLTGKNDAKLTNENGYFPIYYLHWTTYFNLPDKDHQVKSVQGRFVIRTKNGKEVLSTSTSVKGLETAYTRTDYTPTTEFHFSRKRNQSINEFIDEQKQLIKKGLKNYDYQFIVDKVEMQDGTILELKTKL